MAGLPPGTGSLPPCLAHLDDFIASREVACGLWFAGTAQVNPIVRASLDQVQADGEFPIRRYARTSTGLRGGVTSA